MINLKDYKNLKQVKVITKDLETINSLLTTASAMLNPYKKYIPVMEIISVIQNSQTLIRLNINKSHRLLDAKKD